MSWCFKDKSNFTVQQITQKRHLDLFLRVWGGGGGFGFTAPSRLFHYFTGKSKYCSANNSKEAFREQKRNETIIIFFFCDFGFTAPSGLFPYFKGKKLLFSK